MRKIKANQKYAYPKQIIAYCDWFCSNPLRNATLTEFDIDKALDLQALKLVLTGHEIPDEEKNWNYGVSYSVNMKNAPEINKQELCLRFHHFTGTKLQKISADNAIDTNRSFGYYKDAKINILNLTHKTVPSRYLIFKKKRVNACKRYYQRLHAVKN